MTISHPILDRHDAIAWDMDFTLLGGVNTKFFISYISAHPEKRHHVVTFRTGHLIPEILPLLEMQGLDTSLIHSVETVPPSFHDCFYFREKHPDEKYIDWYCNREKITPADFHGDADQYVHWKGKRAKEVGCTILVDDMVEHVQPGCTAHSVELLNANIPI